MVLVATNAAGTTPPNRSRESPICQARGSGVRQRVARHEIRPMPVPPARIVFARKVESSDACQAPGDFRTRRRLMAIR